MFLPHYRPRDITFNNAFPNFVDYLGNLHPRFLYLPNPKLSDIGPQSVANANAVIDTDIPVLNQTTKIRWMWKSQEELAQKYPGTIFEIAGSKASKSIDIEELKKYFEKVGLAKFINDFVLRRWGKTPRDVDPRTTFPLEKDETSATTTKKINEGTLAILKHLAELEGLEYDKENATIQTLLELLKLKSVISYNDFCIILLKLCDAGSGVYRIFCLFSDSNLHLVYLGDGEIEIRTEQGESFLQAEVSKGLGQTRPVNAPGRDYKTCFNFFFRLSQGEPCQFENDYVTYLNTFLDYCADKDAKRVSDLLKNIVGNHSPDAQKAMMTMLLNFEWTLHLGDKELVKKFTPEFIQEIWKLTFDLDPSSYTQRVQYKKNNPLLFLKLEGKSSELIGAALFMGGILTNSLPAHDKYRDNEHFDSALTRHFNKPVLEIILPFTLPINELNGIQEGHSHFIDFNLLRWAQTIDKHFASQDKLYNSDVSDVLEKLFSQSCEALLLDGDALSQVDEQSTHLDASQEEKILLFIEKFSATNNTFLIQTATALASTLMSLGSKKAEALLFTRCLPALKLKLPQLYKAVAEKTLLRLVARGEKTVIEAVFKEIQSLSTIPETKEWSYWLLVLLEKYPEHAPACIHLINPFYLPAHVRARWIILAEDVESAKPMLDRYSANPSKILERIQDETNPHIVLRELRQLYLPSLDPALISKTSSIVFKLFPRLILSSSDPRLHAMFKEWENSIDKETWRHYLQSYFDNFPYDEGLHNVQFHWLGIAVSIGVEVPQPFLNGILAKEFNEVNPDWQKIFDFLERINKNPAWMAEHAERLNEFAKKWTRPALENSPLFPTKIAAFPFSKSILSTRKGTEFIFSLISYLIEIGTEESIQATAPLLQLFENTFLSNDVRTKLGHTLAQLKKLTKKNDLLPTRECIKRLQLHSDIVSMAIHLHLDLLNKNNSESILRLFDRIDDKQEEHLVKLRAFTLKSTKQQKPDSNLLLELLSKPNAFVLLGENVWFQCFTLWMKIFPFNEGASPQYLAMLELFFKYVKANPHAAEAARHVFEAQIIHKLFKGDSIICSKLLRLLPAFEGTLPEEYRTEIIHLGSSLDLEEYFSLTQIYLMPSINEKPWPPKLKSKLPQTFKRIVTYDISKALQLLILYPHLNTKENWLLVWKQKQALDDPKVLTRILGQWKPRIAIDQDVETGALVLQSICRNQCDGFELMLSDIPYCICCLNIPNITQKESITIALLGLLKEINDKEGFKLLFKAFPPKCSLETLPLHLKAMKLDDTIEESCVEFISSLGPKLYTVKTKVIEHLTDLLKQKNEWSDSNDIQLLKNRKIFFTAVTNLIPHTSPVIPTLYGWLLGMPLLLRDGNYIQTHLLRDLTNSTASWPNEVTAKVVNHIDETLKGISLAELRKYNQIMNLLKSHPVNAEHYAHVQSRLLKEEMKSFLSLTNIAPSEIEKILDKYLDSGLQDFHYVAIELLCRVSKNGSGSEIFSKYAPQLFRPHSPQACFEAFCLYVKFDDEIHYQEAVKNLTVILQQPNLLEYPTDMLELGFWRYFSFANADKSKVTTLAALHMLEPYSERKKDLAAWEILSSTTSELALSPTDEQLVDHLIYLAQMIIRFVPRRFEMAIAECEKLIKRHATRSQVFPTFITLINRMVDTVFEECKGYNYSDLEPFLLRILPLFSWTIFPEQIFECCNLYLAFMAKTYEVIEDRNKLRDLYNVHCKVNQSLRPEIAVFCDNNVENLHWLLRGFSFKKAGAHFERKVISSLIQQANEELEKIAGMEASELDKKNPTLRLFSSILLQWFNYKYTNNQEFISYDELKSLTGKVSRTLCQRESKKARDRFYYHLFKYSLALLEDSVEKNSFLEHLQDAIQRKAPEVPFLIKTFGRSYSLQALGVKMLQDVLIQIMHLENPHEAIIDPAEYNEKGLIFCLRVYFVMNKKLENTFWLAGLIPVLPKSEAVLFLEECIRHCLQKYHFEAVFYYLIILYEYIKEDESDRQVNFNYFMACSSISYEKPETVIPTLDTTIQFFNILILLAESEWEFNRILPFLLPILLSTHDIDFSKIHLDMLHVPIINYIRSCPLEDITIFITHFKKLSKQFTPSKRRELLTEMLIRLYDLKQNEHLECAIVLLKEEMAHNEEVSIEQNLWIKKMELFCLTLLQAKEVRLLAQLPGFYFIMEQACQEAILDLFLDLLDDVNDDTQHLLNNLLKSYPFPICERQLMKFKSICNKHFQILDRAKLVLACIQSSNHQITSIGLELFRTLISSSQNSNAETITLLLGLFQRVKFKSISFVEQCTLLFDAFCEFKKTYILDPDLFTDTMSRCLENAANPDEFYQLIDEMLKRKLITSGYLNHTNQQELPLIVAQQLALFFLKEDCQFDLKNACEILIEKFQPLFKPKSFPKDNFIHKSSLSHLSTCLIPYHFRTSFYLMVIHQLHSKTITKTKSIACLNKLTTEIVDELIKTPTTWTANILIGALELNYINSYAAYNKFVDDLTSRDTRDKLKNAGYNVIKCSRTNPFLIGKIDALSKLSHTLQIWLLLGKNLTKNKPYWKNALDEIFSEMTGLNNWHRIGAYAAILGRACDCDYFSKTQLELYIEMLLTAYESKIVKDFPIDVVTPNLLAAIITTNENNSSNVERLIKPLIQAFKTCEINVVKDKEDLIGLLQVIENLDLYCECVDRNLRKEFLQTAKMWLTEKQTLHMDAEIASKIKLGLDVKLLEFSEARQT